MQNRERDSRNAISNSICGSTSSGNSSRTNSPFDYNAISRIQQRSYPPPPPPHHSALVQRPRMPRDLSLTSPLTSTKDLPTPAFSASAILTDIGICVRMQNVHLTSIHPHPAAASIMPSSSSILAASSSASPATLSKKQFNHHTMSATHVNPPNVVLNANTNDTMIVKNNQNLSCDIIPSCCNFSKFQKVNDIITNGETFVVSDFSNKPKSRRNNIIDMSARGMSCDSVLSSQTCKSADLPIFNNSTKTLNNTGPVRNSSTNLKKSPGHHVRNSVVKCINKSPTPPLTSPLTTSQAVYSQIYPPSSPKTHELQNGFRNINQFAAVRLEKKSKDLKDRLDDGETIPAPPPKKKWIQHYLMGI